MTMGDRLKDALDLRRTKPPELIAACKLSKGAVYNILNDVTKPDKVRADTVRKIHERTINGVYCSELR